MSINVDSRVTAWRCCGCVACAASLQASPDAPRWSAPSAAREAQPRPPPSRHAASWRLPCGRTWSPSSPPPSRSRCRTCPAPRRLFIYIYDAPGHYASATSCCRGRRSSLTRLTATQPCVWMSHSRAFHHRLLGRYAVARKTRPFTWRASGETSQHTSGATLLGLFITSSSVRCATACRCLRRSAPAEKQM
jgi:hypothetical protein